MIGSEFTYASLVPSGTIQYCDDGTPKIIVDNQHSIIGMYENNTNMNIPLVINPTTVDTVDSGFT